MDVNQAQLVALISQFLRATSIPNPSWNTAAWYIDPSNASGHASDLNDGTTALTPLLTFAELYKRWGTLTPVLAQDTTITVLSDQVAPFNDPVILTPYVAPASAEGSFNLIGTPTQLDTGTFNVTQVKDRTAGHRWQITAVGKPGGYWAPFVDCLVHDTTQNAWFWVTDDNGGELATISEPLAPATLDNPFPAEVTIHDGDAFTIYRPTTLYIPIYNPLCASGLIPFMTGIQQTSAFESLGVFAEIVIQSAFCTLCRFDGFIAGTQATSDFILTNCEARGGMDLAQGYIIAGAIDAPGGGFSGFSVGAGAAVQLDADVVVGDFAGINGTVNIGYAYLHPNFNLPNEFGGLAGTLNISANAGFYGGAALWGPAALAVHPGGLLMVDGVTFVNGYLLTGALSLDGDTVASAYDDSVNPGVWHSGRALTPTNLDTPIGGGGFGGTAYGHKGTRITTY